MPFCLNGKSGQAAQAATRPGSHFGSRGTTKKPPYAVKHPTYQQRDDIP
jgi:hypothetical protein